MSSYNERFLQYHRYFTDLSEDVLATTLFLPFTIFLDSTNKFSDLFLDARFIPQRVTIAFWNIARLMLTRPLYIAKTLISFTLAPVLAALAAACFSFKPGNYSYPLGRFFERLTFNRENPFILPISLLILADAFPFLAAFYFSMAFGIDIALLPITLLSSGVSIPIMLQIAPLALPWILLMKTLPTAARWGLWATNLSLWVEGLFNPITKLASNLLYDLTARAQYYLLTHGVNPKKLFRIINDEEVTGDPVEDIAPTDLFVSNTNHAFDLNNLERNVGEHRGLQNYYIRERTNLDGDDVLRLEQHPGVKSGRFPQLKQFIAEHKQEYVKKALPAGIISEETFNQLENLTTRMTADHSDRNFYGNYDAAKNAWATYLQTLSPQERESILSLNLSRGGDPYYRLDRSLERVYQGHDCEFLFAGDLRRAIQHKRQVQGVVGDEYKVFWQRPRPTRVGS